jgi:diguanylate cyclase (GGDEF)-like protein
MAVLDERVCLLKDSGVIFWDFSGDASLAGKNIFSVSRPDASFTAPWEPALLAGLEKPLRLNAVLLSGKDTSTPCALTFSPLRGSEGKRFLLIIHGADSVPAAGGQRQEDQRDSLTGLYSHSRFHLILEEEAEEARKTGASMGILYCDLNNFRRINEQYGYLAGDALLTRLADCFTAVPDNETRFACRYEGDDFVLLIPRANAALLESTARDLDRRVRRISREALSIRIGLALIVPGQAPVARMHMARAACGRAKITRKPFFWSG